MFKSRKVKLVLSLIVSFFAVYLFLFSPFFRIREVEGVPEEKGEKYMGKNIFLLSTSRVREEWIELPEVKDTVVEKKIPSLLRIRVEKRKPVLSFYRDRKWWGVDEEGVIFPLSKPMKSLPLFWREKEIEPGKSYPDLRGAVEIYLQFREKLPQWEVRSLEVKKGGIILRTTKGITVIFGLEDIPSQVKRLKKIIETLSPLSSIDLRFGEEVIVK